MNAFIHTLQKNVEVLTQPSAVEEFKYIPQEEKTLPNIDQLKEIVYLIRSILFPGYFGVTGRSHNSQQYYVGVNIEKLYSLLDEQIYNGLHFFHADGKGEEAANSSELALIFIDRLPEIKRLLCTDIKAVFDGDPAARSYGEVIFCYPAIQAMINYRIAHELLKLNVPVIPRIITELAHSATGIDIHPGATIGEYFSIDHGTGVVIGETCVIGNHVRLYQGVTLGAKSFKLDDEGLPMNIPRHPILEDHVIVYSNSTILGRITIGHHSVIGGNIWQTSGVPPYSRILQRKAVSSSFVDGAGI
ncbi:MAG: serine acetyltransferase [Tannerellaceae bacterium]|nr:serine acetyltransferase [Tannerellaceae bacterium]